MGRRLTNNIACAKAGTGAPASSHLEEAELPGALRCDDPIGRHVLPATDICDDDPLPQLRRIHHTSLLQSWRC